ncbi:MAG TPA: recombinase family protein [Acidobacteriaceae bacterium]|nr:recombinase family protein [Acidobacteriaceae bacterium]
MRRSAALGKLALNVLQMRGTGGRRMAYVERIRDMITGPLLDEIVKQRVAAGWHLVSVEWRRELPDSEMPTEGAYPEDIPYGLRVSDDCKGLVVDETEQKALLQMMEMLVQDFSFSSIASDLNEKGFRTRDGKRWNPVTIFTMIPRLIDVGPRLFSMEEWEKRRAKFARMV